MTDLIINNIADAEAALGPLVAAAMATGLGAFEALAMIQTGLDHLKRNYTPRPQLPSGYEESLSEAFGDLGESGNLGERGNG